eukprot:c5338_g1_i1.p1 GENE.c5338_g1_i1~~c5338_g1_i1.p1  ORF type:complete len:439 (+),score=131.27 c5338_g1_i1:235-1551(+)
MAQPSTPIQSHKKIEKAGVEHFEWGEELGEGSFGTVRRAKLIATGQEYAVKILDKKHVIKMDKVKYVTSERDILFKLDHPNVIKLHHTFQDANSLYFVMELASGGELFEQIQKFGPAHIDCARFYSAEIVNAIEYLHSKGIVHRDLKPENMLVSGDGHIKISDFGSAAAQTNPSDSKMTFVGTAEYVSPEVLNNETATSSSDLWALGCVIYQILAGNPPFKGDTDYIIFQKILKLDFIFPPNFPEDAKSLVNQLLVIDPSHRLGADGNLQSIKDHPFFTGIDFASLHKQVPPPFHPNPVSVHTPRHSDEYCAFENFQRAPLDVVEIQTLIEKQSQLPWRTFLLPNEAMILSGILHKRVGLFARPRLFILTTFPRLLYINTERKEKRGEIPWSFTRLEMIDSTTLYIHTPSRIYYLESVNNPQRWIDAINFLRKSIESN